MSEHGVELGPFPAAALGKKVNLQLATCNLQQLDQKSAFRKLIFSLRSSGLMNSGARAIA